MERFEELKNEILRRAHEAHACTEQYGRAYKSETLDGEYFRASDERFRRECLGIEKINDKIEIIQQSLF